MARWRLAFGATPSAGFPPLRPEVAPAGARARTLGVIATRDVWKGKSVSVFETTSGKELARIASSRRVPSGLVIFPDSRYAFVTQEGVGSEPGAVDVIDLGTLQRVASVDVGRQAGGIDFWKAEAVAR